MARLFSHGPFSIICNVLGAASSFQGVEGYNIFWKFLCRFAKITRGSKNFLQKCHFWAKRVNIFFKNGILGGAIYKHFEPPKLKGRKKSLGCHMWPPGRTLAMSDLFSLNLSWRPSLWLFGMWPLVSTMVKLLPVEEGASVATPNSAGGTWLNPTAGYHSRLCSLRTIECQVRKYYGLQSLKLVL